MPAVKATRWTRSEGPRTAGALRAFAGFPVLVVDMLLSVRSSLMLD